MADGDGHEFHLSPHRFKSGDERGVLVGFFLKPPLASEVLAKSDLGDDEVALIVVEGGRVRRRGVRYPSGVDEVGGGAACPARKKASWVSWGSI